MVQRVKTFSEGCRKGLGIVVRCHGCGKFVTYRASDFRGYIAPAAEIEDLRWRCTWCRQIATYVRYVLIMDINRESLCQWIPPKGRPSRY